MERFDKYILKKKLKSLGKVMSEFKKKLKILGRTFQKQSGSVKIMSEQYDKLVQIWDGSASTEPLSFGVDVDSFSEEQEL